MEQIIQTFSESFKRSVVDQVNNGLISKEEARRHYGIKTGCHSRESGNLI